MIIKDNLEKLKTVKNKSIKELVYTNRDIPNKWKNKLDYKQNLLKIFLNDSTFLRYLGNGGPPIIAKSQRIKDKPGAYNNIESNEINKMNKERIKILTETKEKEKIINSPYRAISNKNISKFNRFREKHNYLDKEVIGILDDFKMAYPILIKEKDKENNNEINKNKDENKLRNRNSLTFHEIKSRNTNNIISFPNLKLKNNNKRQITFRQNIFTNLLPSKQKYNTVSKLEGNKTFTDFYKIKGDLYLNSYNELFDKKVSINNPLILKYLEGINFYGPYFSYCPPCGNKNLEFYKNLEQKQCLQIIQQIKKNKGKNIVLSDEKNKKIKDKKKEKINDIFDKNDSESYNYNLKNVNSNSSKKDYSKEKFDIVH